MATSINAPEEILKKKKTLAEEDRNAEFVNKRW